MLSEEKKAVSDALTGTTYKKNQKKILDFKIPKLKSTFTKKNFILQAQSAILHPGSILLFLLISAPGFSFDKSPSDSSLFSCHIVIAFIT